ncbi:telomere-associated protein 1 [Fusarium oxysporum f. sp. albedinis]|nr:telomere-associated protein 1 [Fusarium oxysporum f. sp. albedinis]
MHFFKLLFCCHFSTTSASNSLQPRPVELQRDGGRRYSSRHPNHAASEYGNPSPSQQPYLVTRLLGEECPEVPWPVADGPSPVSGDLTQLDPIHLH